MYSSLEYFDENQNPRNLLERGDLKRIKNYRTSELLTIQETNDDQTFYLTFIFDKKSIELRNALFSIFRTIFVCIVLASASLVFSKDLTEIIFGSLEKLLKKKNVKIENNKNGDSTDKEIMMIYQLFKEKNIFIKKNKNQKIFKENFENLLESLGGLITNNLGDSGSKMILEFMSEEVINTKKPGIWVPGVFVCIKLNSVLQKMKKIYKKDTII